MPGASRRDHAAARRLAGRRSTRRSGRCERLCRRADQPAAGAAFYQQAELHRLRGEFAQAEEAYRQASQWGREPQPGLALLRLAQGQARCRGGGDPPRGGRGAGPLRALAAARRATSRSCSPPATSAAARAAADELSADRRRPRRAAAARARRPGARARSLLAEGDAASRARRAAPGLGGLAGARGALRSRARPGPHRPRLPRARATRTPRAMELDAARWVFAAARRRARPGPGRGALRGRHAPSRRAG